MTNNSTPDWSGQQEGALRDVKTWLKDKKGSQVFRLFGYAGTGKTTLAKEIASDVDGKVMFGAFTGKAASVMRQKGCHKASTIHAMIYKLDEEKNGQPEFILDEDSDVKNADVVIIDECSMVDETIGKDLLSFGTKILVIGDPAQLPPVKGAGFFTSHKPDVMLTEVHRQARDNPIIAMSMKIREGEFLDYGTYGSSKVIKRAELTPGEVMGADQIIVGLNKTRHRYNTRMRELLHRENPYPVKGEKLVCLRNDRKVGIFNGTIWEVQKCKESKKNGRLKMLITSMDDEDAKPRKVEVLPQFFTGDEASIPWEWKRGTQEFTYGYALTCHKSQGSQWPNIVIFDEGRAFREDAARWAYTAITRGAERVTLVR